MPLNLGSYSSGINLGYAGVYQGDPYPAQIPILCDSNSIMANQKLGESYSGDAYANAFTLPVEITEQGGTVVSGGEQMAFKNGATATNYPIGDNVNDYLSPPAGFAGWMRSTHELKLADDSTATWTVEYEVTDGGIILPVLVEPLPDHVIGESSTISVDVKPSFENADTYEASGLPVSTGFVVSDGVFSGSPAQADRDNSPLDITITASNAYDSVEDIFTLTIQAAPSITISGQTTTDNTPTIVGTCSDSEAALELTVNGVTYTPALSGTDWSQTLQTLPIGTHEMTLTATDDVGNVSTATDSVVIEPVPAFAPLFSTSIRLAIKTLFVNTDVDLELKVHDGFELSDVAELKVMLRSADASPVEVIKTLGNGIQTDGSTIMLNINRGDVERAGVYELHAAFTDQQGKYRGLTLTPSSVKFEKFLL